MKGRILIVDDEEVNRVVLSRILEIAGYEVISARDGAEAIDKVENEKPDVIILDLIMPQISGIDVLSILKERYDLRKMPVIVLTALGDIATKREAFELGAIDFIVKPFDKEDLMIRLNNILKIKSYYELIESYNVLLEEEVERRTQMLKHMMKKLEDIHEDLIFRLGKAAEYRDDATGNHAKRVGKISYIVAETLGLNRERCKIIELASPMHDIGKIGIPDNILLKSGKLTHEEFEIMKRHTIIGYDILSGSEHPLLIAAANIALYHHERWDGKGYPFGLEKEMIPLDARIVAVTDFFDACTSKRIYRKEPMEIGRTLEIIKDERGKHFDPLVVDAFFDSIGEILKVKEELYDGDIEYHGDEKGKIYPSKGE